jgi:S1-C subfamily serine protease
MKSHDARVPIIVVIVLLLAAAGGFPTERTGAFPAAPRGVIQTGGTANLEEDCSFERGFAAVISRTIPAVVYIASSKRVGPGGFTAQLDGSRLLLERSLGSGVIVTSDGT